MIIIIFIMYRGLDLTGFLHCRDDPQPLYDLFAVSNHFGGMGGGHCESCSHTFNRHQSYILQILLMQRTTMTINGTTLMTVMLPQLQKTI